jgi:hypothetical protein
MLVKIYCHHQQALPLAPLLVAALFLTLQSPQIRLGLLLLLMAFIRTLCQEQLAQQAVAGRTKTAHHTMLCATS